MCIEGVTEIETSAAIFEWADVLLDVCVYPTMPGKSTHLWETFPTLLADKRSLLGMHLQDVGHKGVLAHEPPVATFGVAFENSLLRVRRNMLIELAGRNACDVTVFEWARI